MTSARRWVRAGGIAVVVVPLLVGCARPVVKPVAAPPEPAGAVPVAAAPVSPWAALPVRVMTWTPRGVQQIGEWPGAVPQPMPERWYVEPIGKLDEAALDRLAGLVRSERVPGLSLRNQPVAPWLGALRDLPELGALLLDGTGTDGAALGAMQLSLTRLYLARTAIDDAAVAALVERYPGLEALDVEGTGVGDGGARAIARLAELRALNAAGTAITDDGGAALGALGKLEIIDLGGTKIGRKTIAALRQLPVRELFLDHTRVRGEIATLATLAPRLVRFDVSGTAHHPTDAELAWLANAPNLIEIGISGAKVHDALALALVKIAGLRELRMAQTSITNATIRAIAERAALERRSREDQDDGRERAALERRSREDQDDGRERAALEEVDLADTPVDDASAAAILGAPEMRIVRLDGAPISDAALAGRAGGKLVELYLSRTSIGDGGLAFLDGAPRLTALGLGHTNLGDSGIERIAKLAGLRTLVLSNVHVQTEALAKLGALRALERLYLAQVHVTDEVLAALAPARDTLRVLHLAGSDVSEDGLPALRAFGELEELTIGDSRMHEGIADLSAWPRLRVLSLIGLELTDKVLPVLAAHPSLAVLDLSATEIRDPSPLAALPRLRTLGIAQNRLSAAGVAAVKRLIARGVEVVR